MENSFHVKQCVLREKHGRNEQREKEVKTLEGKGPKEKRHSVERLRVQKTEKKNRKNDLWT